MLICLLKSKATGKEYLIRRCSKCGRKLGIKKEDLDKAIENKNELMCLDCALKSMPK
jgi:DNA-directed RNA polymerase subunit RPC12/RpoP